MNDSLMRRIEETGELHTLFQPALYRASRAEDAAHLATILSDNPQIAVFDTLRCQVEELTKTRYPRRKLMPAELAELVRKHLQGRSESECGVWVHYPWSNRLVHVLDKEEFAELRTNRNVYKITVEEQRALARRTIGIVGLSVGQSVALTLAMERGFGELRIADFDAIDLSNLNRIRAGVHDIGVPKVIAVAREIAEIDPFLTVKCFPEGLIEDNMDRFFLEGGRVDLLIDECDGLDVKVLARRKARKLGIPVVMETSDRGMIDIERFDLEPERPILHGLIEHLDTTNLKGLSNEEKVPYVLSIIGVDTMSDRMKASLLEVEQSIATWPQLAGDVVLGGATTANVCRRIALNQMNASGRFFVDLDAIVSDNAGAPLPGAETAEGQQEDSTPRAKPAKPPIKPTATADSRQVALEEATVTQLVEAAAFAPSGGNMQPWQWLYADRSLHLFLDPSRGESYLDFERMGSYLSLGAAAENLVLKAHELQLEVAIDVFPDAADSKDSELVAVFRFFHDDNVGRSLEPRVADPLVATICERLTNRNIASRTQIDTDRLERLQSMARTVDGAQLHLLTDDRRLGEIGEIIACCDRLLLTSKEGHQGFVHEIRWTPADAQRTRDGVDLETIDLTPGEAAGFRVAKRWRVIEHLARWGGGTVFEKLARKSVAAASAVGLLTMPEYSAASYFDAGRAVQRIWLQANQDGICLQPMSVAAFLFTRLLHGGGASMTPAMREELEELQRAFVQLFNLTRQQYGVFLFRLFEAGPPRARSLRRSVEDILICQ